MNSKKGGGKYFPRSLFSLKKRGVVEIQFNWIFILIAGAIIIAFFVSVVQFQRRAADSKTNAIILTNLEAILTGAKVSTSTVNVVDIPDSEIGFDCSKYFIGSANQRVQGRTIFSPSLLKGRKLITWALPWEVPFKVTNFLYLTSPQVRYIVVHNNNANDPLFVKIYESLPDELNKESVALGDLGNVNDENNYKVKFVFVNAVPADVPGLSNAEDVTGVWFDDSINVKYYVKNGITFQDAGTSYYFKEPAILAAIFSEDMEAYECGMRKAFKQYDIMSDIYRERSDELSVFYSVISASCSTYHVSAKNILDDINTEAKIVASAASIQADPINQLHTHVNLLEQQNVLTELFSCAMVY